MQPPPVYKSSCPTGCQPGGAGFWTDSHPNPPRFQLLASEIKQTFLSTNLACLLAFEQPADGPHTLLVTVTAEGLLRGNLVLNAHTEEKEGRKLMH